MDATRWFHSLFRLFALNLCAIVVLNLIIPHQAASASSSPNITIYTARKIITMDPARPLATAVAVKDGKILSVGSLHDMEKWMEPGTYRIDNQFYDDVITPGMIESQSHISLLVLFLGYPYIGYHDTLGPDAIVLPGIKSRDAVIKMLKEEAREIAHPSDTLIAWGYDPVYFDNQPLTISDLDNISQTRPVFILSASGHVAYVNSVLLKKAGITAETTIPGVMKDKNGNPTGVLKEDAAMLPAIKMVYRQLTSADDLRAGLEGVANLANHVGLTTITDSNFGGPHKNAFLSALKSIAKSKSFPIRIIVVQNGEELNTLENRQSGSGLKEYSRLKEYETDKLLFSGIKYILDGSIQDFTAALKWPGYFQQKDKTTITTSKERLKKDSLPFWKAGIPIHIHVSGNQATDDALDILEYLQNENPRRNSQFILEHNDMSSEEQFVRAKKLGAYTILIPNNIYFYGEQHYSTTLGPDRAEAISNTAEAKKSHIRFALGSNAPETSLNPLLSIWSAVNRTTETGRVLGKNNSISPRQALEAVTINAAYMHNLQDKIGSIEVGKKADFTILKYDPLSIRPYTIKDIPVIATIVDGIVYPVRASSSF